MVLLFLVSSLLFHPTLYAQKNSLSRFDLGLQFGGIGFVSFMAEKNFKLGSEGKVAAHLRTGIAFIFDPLGGEVAVGIPIGTSMSFGGLYRFELGTEMAYYIPSEFQTDGGYYPVSLGLRLQKTRLVARVYLIPIMRWHDPHEGWLPALWNQRSDYAPWAGVSIAYVL
jgi:hypothetical protein